MEEFTVNEQGIHPTPRIHSEADEKALNLVVPPDAQRFDGACPYRDVAITNELGEYI